jgi:coenzyme PQQ precursor peptide PqqA
MFLAERVPRNTVLQSRQKECLMKLRWHKPVVLEQEVGLEVTSYASAELAR